MTQTVTSTTDPSTSNWTLTITINVNAPSKKDPSYNNWQNFTALCSTMQSLPDGLSRIKAIAAAMGVSLGL